MGRLGVGGEETRGRWAVCEGKVMGRSPANTLILNTWREMGGNREGPQQVGWGQVRGCGGRVEEVGGTRREESERGAHGPVNLGLCTHITPTSAGPRPVNSVKG